MVITVNGKTEEIAEPTRLVDFMKTKDIDPQAVVIELNQSILEKETLAEVVLQDKDTLEILRFVGGG